MKRGKSSGHSGISPYACWSCRKGEVMGKYQQQLSLNGEFTVFLLHHHLSTHRQKPRHSFVTPTKIYIIEMLIEANQQSCTKNTLGLRTVVKRLCNMFKALGPRPNTKKKGSLATQLCPHMISNTLQPKDSQGKASRSNLKKILYSSLHPDLPQVN